MYTYKCTQVTEDQSKAANLILIVELIIKSATCHKSNKYSRYNFVQLHMVLANSQHIKPEKCNVRMNELPLHEDSVAPFSCFGTLLQQTKSCRV